MTATVVTVLDKGPLKVVATEPVLSPLSGDNGREIYFKRIVKLLLEDGTELYGCTECEYVAEKVGSVRPHLSKHGARKTGRPSNDERSVQENARVMAELTLADILELADRALVAENDHDTVRQRLLEERDSWKERAKAAEGKLKKLQAAFGALNGEL